jgi:hypothetical protein
MKVISSLVALMPINTLVIQVVGGCPIRRQPLTGVSAVPSAGYCFTILLPTNDLGCIERNAVSDETARALRNEMKSSNAKTEEARRRK